MKKIERFWNIIYFNVYRFDLKCTDLLNYLNPFIILNKMANVKKHHAKYGVVDMNIFAKRLLNNPKSGISSIWAGSFMGSLLVSVGIGLINIIETIIGRSVIQDVTYSVFNSAIFLFVLMIPTIIINRYFLFKDDKFLNYFREFELMPKERKIFYSWITFFVIMFIFTFLVLSFLLIY
jgi:integral membrane sensor domain MASE1